MIASNKTSEVFTVQQIMLMAQCAGLIVTNPNNISPDTRFRLQHATIAPEHIDGVVIAGYCGRVFYPEQLRPLEEQASSEGDALLIDV
ncbi:hypothetical protein GBN32_00265 [Plesiomonas shigelloides]|uniref:hypothetical protein n=1 Tax=Plesiomonas shigelloides TaxID=703 RepID=UPI001261DEAE|nr:hypothetical protein [Plesiomonas shigelloides]KAB7715706.1 hypothetical protein GBN32_00265 [Plesiomonas shigelloides]